MEYYSWHEKWDSTILSGYFPKTDAWRSADEWRDEILKQPTEKDFESLDKRRAEIFKNWNEDLRKALMF